MNDGRQSDKHVSLCQCVIYWFHIMGEWFHIMGEFGSFSLFHRHSAVHLFWSCSRVSASSCRFDMDGVRWFTFSHTVVGVVSWDWMAVLCSSILGQQSEDLVAVSDVHGPGPHHESSG